MIASLRHGHPVATDELVCAIYGYRSDGGPDRAEHAVRTQIYKMRQKLEALGIVIETVGYGRGAVGYRVKPEHCPALAYLMEQSVI
jgi:DNA-binding response OmpR family regulator